MTPASQAADASAGPASASSGEFFFFFFFFFVAEVQRGRPQARGEPGQGGDTGGADCSWC